jgi:membrane fusion protein, copper/silver efflux system
MKRGLKFSILILLGVFVLGSVVWRVQSDRTHEHGSHAAKETSVYYCPMHPDYTADKKGSCPICGMDLVKAEVLGVYEGADEEARGGTLVHTSESGAVVGYAPVKLSPEKQQLIGVRLALVEEKAATKVIRTVGRIAYDPELYQAEEEYLQAVRALEKAKASLDPDIEARAKKLVESATIKLELMGLNDDLIQELEEKDVADKSLLLGKAGGTVWMYAPIYENDLDAVEVGQDVLVTSQGSVTGRKYEGKVRAIDPVLDATTRSVRIRARLENQDGSLKPNVYVNAEIKVDLGSQLLIPESAVLDSGQRQVAFVGRGNGIFEPRILQLGPKVGNDYVLVSGVSKGEHVVDQATFFVDSESKLKAAIGKASGGGHQHG